ncbi:hypothetical protein F4781DRAFT_431567 [Annulohypoxylon bovei var. microspora]|nr:hypothetical protein F4781DRAFT_431567 [Annulohypoxylon bovei var. microspora]
MCCWDVDDVYLEEERARQQRTRQYVWDGSRWIAVTRDTVEARHTSRYDILGEQTREDDSQVGDKVTRKDKYVESTWALSYLKPNG